ncbi:MAG: hypothetical protein PVF85_07640 [Anaerolineales bacterium]|jgi:hypothetical protein
MSLRQSSLPWKWLIFGGVVLSIAFYLAFSAYLFRIGYPLDDAWIHQTYARNLIEYGRWVYTQNTGGGGSTAPLWTIITSLGYFFKVPPKLWTYFLGGATLFFTAFFGVRWYADHSEANGHSKLGPGLLIIFEWHLVWAACSGMETLSIGMLAVLFFWILQRNQDRTLIMGGLIGVGMWLRPDAILLILPALWVAIFSRGSNRDPAARSGQILRLILSVAIMIVPYLIFNSASAGSVWPTTFFAKQAEYAVLREQPLLSRILSLVQAPLAGVSVLLLPAFIYQAVDVIRRKEYARLAPFLWVASYLGAYALRLPVTYQHGRYLMPVLPTSIVLSYFGLSRLLAADSKKSTVRILQRTWRLAIPVVLLIFWVIGAQAYARDVAVIESEMVDTSLWIQANTPSGSKIAAHDIGAFGYFAQRDLLDLAGLVSPQVIPIIRDEPALKELMDDEHVDYLMTFPGWYPELSEAGEKVFQSTAQFSSELGGEKMTVYRWP